MTMLLQTLAWYSINHVSLSSSLKLLYLQPSLCYFINVKCNSGLFLTSAPVAVALHLRWMVCERGVCGPMSRIILKLLEFKISNNLYRCTDVWCLMTEEDKRPQKCRECGMHENYRERLPFILNGMAASMIWYHRGRNSAPLNGKHVNEYDEAVSYHYKRRMLNKYYIESSFSLSLLGETRTFVCLTIMKDVMMFKSRNNLAIKYIHGIFQQMVRRAV